MKPYHTDNSSEQFHIEALASLRPRGAVGGLRKLWGQGDRLVSLDGRPVVTAADFRQWIRQLRVGQTARLEVMRNGTVSTVAVRVTGYDHPTVRIQEIADAAVQQLRLRTQWANSEP